MIIQIVRRRNLDVLSDRIQKYLYNGWAMQGGPFVYEGEVCQVMTRSMRPHSGAGCIKEI